ncbi:MAG: 2-dehydropantoate 2-reductase [Magnetococcales bacterium]|nr:2-dehydropantoate 2-reductase [Magnetococcales bacterium]
MEDAAAPPPAPPPPASLSDGTSPPAVLILGAGAVGIFYGGKLARAGVPVSFRLRSADHPALTRGFHVESIDGDFSFQPHRLYTPSDPPPPVFDYVIYCVKALPEIDPAALIRPVLGPGTTLVLLQNGVEIEEPTARAFPDHPLLSALAFVCVSRTAPERVRHLCFGRLALGSYPREGRGRPEAERLARCFEGAGVPCAVAEDIVTERWRKLVWNAPFNPLSALTGASTRRMIEDSAALPLIRGVMEEVRRIAAATGHPLPEEVVEKNIADTRRMEPYQTSMLLDHLAGRPLETEAILGNALRAAHRCGVAAPRLETLHALLTLLAPSPDDASPS